MYSVALKLGPSISALNGPKNTVRQACTTVYIQCTYSIYSRCYLLTLLLSSTYYNTIYRYHIKLAKLLISILIFILILLLSCSLLCILDLLNNLIKGGLYTDALLLYSYLNYL